MDCPICNGTGELEHPQSNFRSNGSADQEQSENRACIGSKINTCFRCCGSGHLETED